MTVTEEIMQAVFTAPDERKQAALSALRGEPVATARPVTGPLLLGVGAGARFLGVSRATLWRAMRAGHIEKVELFAGSYRVRRQDLEALAAGRSAAGRPATVGGGSVRQ